MKSFNRCSESWCGTIIILNTWLTWDSYTYRRGGRLFTGGADKFGVCASRFNIAFNAIDGHSLGGARQAMTSDL